MLRLERAGKFKSKFGLAFVFLWISFLVDIPCCATCPSDMIISSKNDAVNQSKHVGHGDKQTIKVGTETFNMKKMGEFSE